MTLNASSVSFSPPKAERYGCSVRLIRGPDNAKWTHVHVYADQGNERIWSKLYRMYQEYRLKKGLKACEKWMKEKK